MHRRNYLLGLLTLAFSRLTPLSLFRDAQAGSQSDDARLAAFFEAADLERARLSPETLTRRGIKERYGELDDRSGALQLRDLKMAEAQLARMKRKFDRAALSKSSQISFDLFERLIERQRTLTKWYWQVYSLTSGGSSLDDIPRILITQHKIDDIDDANAYISRLRAFERAAKQFSNGIDERRSKGLIPPSFVFAHIIPLARNQITGAPFDSGLDSAIWSDFKAKISALNENPSIKAKLLADAAAALKGEWRRGYLTYIGSLQAMSKIATTDKGVWALPDGDAYYTDMLRYHTTTALSVDEIHQIGLSEVARLKSEMEKVKNDLGSQMPLQEFFSYLKTDERFRYPDTADGKAACLADAKTRISDYMAVASKQFSTLPVLPLEVRAVESFREKTAAAVPAYQPGTPDGSRPGTVYFNLYDMNQVLKPLLPGLTYHEGVPGHHFQVGRQFEQMELPSFRRFLFLTAYTEGWALYAEGLPKEIGFYRDPYDDFGRLTLDIWRAARLVLDTGINAKRWTRDQAVEFMRLNTAISERDIQSEIDRYFTDPGQATGYKIGQLRILALRQKAAAELGSEFDIRSFHEAILKNGALPLDMLEAEINTYVMESRH